MPQRLSRYDYSQLRLLLEYTTKDVGGPHGRIRTLNLPGRNRLLCPVELRGGGCNSYPSLLQKVSPRGEVVQSGTTERWGLRFILMISAVSASTLIPTTREPMIEPATRKLFSCSGRAS